MKRPAIALLLVSLALVLVAWRWNSTTVGVRGLESNSSATPAARAPEFVDRGPLAPGMQTRSADAPHLPETAPAARSAVLVPTTAPEAKFATLEVRVIDQGTGLGLAGLELGIDQLADVRATTDLEGSASLRLPPGAPWSLHVRSNGFLNVDERRFVRPLDDDESRALRVELNLPERERYFARVLDKETRRAVVGAGVFVPFGTAAIASTDASGVFEIPFAPENPIVLEIRAPGFAEAMLTARAGHANRAGACELMLERTGSLLVRLQGIEAASFNEYSMSLAGSVPGYSDFEGWISSQRSRTQSNRVAGSDHEGNIHFEGLQPNVDLDLYVMRNSQSQRDLRLPAVRLAPGERRELIVRLDSLCSLRGHTVDARGDLVPMAQVWLLPWSQGEDLTALSSNRFRMRVSVTSDAAGAFNIDGVMPGSWALSPAIEEYQGLPKEGDPEPVAVARRMLPVLIPNGLRELAVELVVRD